MEYYDFKVAPYALVDVIKGLHNSLEHNQIIDIIVTKEDDDLVVKYKVDYIPTNGKNCNAVSPKQKEE